ncbi:hypothetical protein KHM25_17160 [Leptospira borgpetersenii]|uniref:Uncharacterized protein n=1 Tax=Leptospira borgpetersenii str. Brem 328 TaxID=1049780 RepID=A0ABC9SDS4_LEPBO|nr:hypothetical protein LEP1GSC101_0996 [Leptospira borgpetersenii str. UI 09149]EMN11826.1 hypothetical protein LEP1GSC055_2603 [Leptospira borgpetersenii str. Brem 307]EMN15548.1 hypothetical protein LEP1GSC056_3489 [Leptospira borgpetersenii str. Brem 328]GIM25791.1 hypothetical protein KHM25_17160 [Leptospira borgpetersenii]EMN13656.1 hypothetical protein LEP1GSC055_3253 [Leptospira borgpetersenii str. Brem 307]
MRAFTTKQENQQKERNEKKITCRNGCPQRNDQNRVFNEQFKGNIERATNKIGRSADQEIHQSVKIRMG